MLLQFAVTNHRSFREETVLSMLAVPDLPHPEGQVFEVPDVGPVLRCVAIYATLLRARIVGGRSYGVAPGPEVPVRPHLLIASVLLCACRDDPDHGTACVVGPVEADAPLTLTVEAFGDADQRLLERSCEATVDPAARRVTLDTTVRYGPDPSPFAEADMLVILHFDCVTAPLAEGDWTVVWGEDELDVQVPDDRAEPGCLSASFPDEHTQPGDDETDPPTP